VFFLSQEHDASNVGSDNPRKRQKEEKKCIYKIKNKKETLERRTDAKKKAGEEKNEREKKE